MNINELHTKIGAIAADTSKSVERRIEEVFVMRSNLRCADETEEERCDAAIFQALLEMVGNANTDHLYDTDMFQLYTLLAETYGRLLDFRPVKGVADGLIRLLGNCEVSIQVIQQAVPRVLDVVRQSAYHHERYRLLGAFLHAAYAAASAGEIYDEELVRRHMREFLNLRGLLDPATRPDILDADLQIFIAWHIPGEEFERIIDHPAEGHLRRDPVEYTLRWEEVCYDVEDELKRRFADTPRHMGFCFGYWSEMALLLRGKYGIEWKNPHIMNPGVIFD